MSPAKFATEVEAFNAIADKDPKGLNAIIREATDKRLYHLRKHGAGARYE